MQNSGKGFISCFETLNIRILFEFGDCKVEANTYFVLSLYKIYNIIKGFYLKIKFIQFYSFKLIIFFLNYSVYCRCVIQVYNI